MKGHGGVAVKSLLYEVDFLYELLHREFIYKPEPNDQGVNDINEHTNVLLVMVGRGILKLTSPDNAASKSLVVSSSSSSSSLSSSTSSTEDSLVEVSSQGESLYSFLCALFWPFIDSYYAAAIALFSLQNDTLIEEENELLQRTQWIATTLYHESMLSFYESCNMDTLKNAFDTFAQWGIIVKTRTKNNNNNSNTTGASSSSSDDSGDGSGRNGESKRSQFTVALCGDYRSEKGLQSFVNRIGRLRKQPPVRKNVARRSLIAELPILAKL